MAHSTSEANVESNPDKKYESLVQVEEHRREDDAIPNDTYNRQTWGRGAEFLFSCIAMSVGLGNLWRFPFIAWKNGGGAFVIPYVIVLFVIGKPGYFMEMAIGQFSSKGTIKVYDAVPAMRGVGTGQVLSSVFVATYYSSIMGLTLKYLYESFSYTLPWATCKPEWGDCVSAINDSRIMTNESSKFASSAELYFAKEVYNMKENMMDGVGTLNWNLVMFLGISWTVIFLMLIKGIKSAGKFSYVLAIFPYIMLGILLSKALTLEGSIDGIIYFFKPQWNKILEPSVWFAAVTQVFFSLNVFFANVIMYSSYNKFNHNIYRDANIVTTLDTFTSLLAGVCVFAVLGHLKHELQVDDIADVIKPGPGLAFISYPETIAKFKNFSTLFSVLFFVMLYLLGIGSNVAMASCIMTEIKDHFNKVKDWQAALGVAVFGTVFGSIYYTQSGLSILALVDYYGATFVAFNLVTFELITFCHIYGVNKMCKDIKQMLGFEPGLYWRICWKFLTPGFTLFLVIYYYADYANQRDSNLKRDEYPDVAYAIGWGFAIAGLIQLPVIAIYQIYKSEGSTLKEKILNAFKPLPDWGPKVDRHRVEYNRLQNEAEERRKKRHCGPEIVLQGTREKASHYLRTLYMFCASIEKDHYGDNLTEDIKETKQSERTKIYRDIPE